MGAVQEAIRGDVQASMQLLHEMIVERIEEYSGIAGRAAQVQPPPAQRLPRLQAMAAGRSTAVEAQEHKIARLRVAAASDRKRLAQSQQQAEAAQGDVAYMARAVNEAQSRQHAVQEQMRRMGSRPEEVVWYEDVEVERGGFFGSILDFFSPNMESVRMSDDSEGQEWDEAYRRLQADKNKSTAVYDKRRKELAEKERLLQRRQAEAAQDEARIRSIESELRAEEQLLKVEKEKDAAQRKYAMQAYLQQCRKQLNQWVHAHFFGADDAGGEVRRLTDAWKAGIAEGRRDMERRAHALYEDTMAKKIAQLEQAKQEKSPALMREVEDLTRVQHLLAQGIHQMEEDLA